MQSGDSVLESSASFQQIEKETKRLLRPFLARFFFSVMSTATKHLPRPLGLFLWIENETKRLLTRFLQPYLWNENERLPRPSKFLRF